MRYNVLKSCAALSCRACVDETPCVAERYLALRTGCERHGRKNPLPYPISERSHVGNLRRANKQGKGRSSKRKENRRLSFLFAPAAGAALSRAPQSATPSLNFSEKLSARKGRTRLRQFVCPGFPVQKRSRPVRANTLTQFAHTAQPVLKKLPPGRGEPPARFRCPNRPVQRKRVPHTDICPPVKTKYFYALHYKSDVL